MNLEEALWQDPDRMGGALCFRNTRVPVGYLFQYLEGSSLKEFLQNYPNVTADMVRSVLSANQRPEPGP